MRPYVQLAGHYLKEGEEEKGFKYLDMAKEVMEAMPKLQNDREISSYYYNMGTLFLMKDRLDDAETHLLKSIEYKKDKTEVYANLAYLYFKKDDLYKTEENIEKFLEFKDDDPEMLNFLGTVKYLTGNIAEAEELISRSIEMDGNDNSLLNLIAVSLEKHDTKMAKRLLYKSQAKENIRYITFAEILNSGKNSVLLQGKGSFDISSKVFDRFYRKESKLLRTMPGVIWPSEKTMRFYYDNR